MESTLFLRNGPLPSVPLCISFPLSATRLTKPNFSSNHSSLSLPNSSYRRPLRHAISPIFCAVNKFPTPSTNDESKSQCNFSVEAKSFIYPESTTHMLKPADTVVESKKKPPNIESLKVSFSSLFSCFYYEAELQLVLLHA